jgi:quercetin dioxygenase-like cupin family protein
MRLFSISDLPEGRDATTFLTEEDGNGISEAGVRYFSRGSASETESLTDRQVILIIMQGTGTAQVNNVAHPIRQGDFIILEPGDTWRIIADLVNPPVVLSAGVPAKAASPKPGFYPEGRSPSLETQIMGPD